MTEQKVAGDAPARRLCLIVPCYNEAARLNTAAFHKFLETDRATFLLFVNDGSRDATVAVIQTLIAGHENAAALLSLERNSGKAEAVRRGFLDALQRYSPEFIGFWDADLATPLEAVEQLLGILEGNPRMEMVFGARIQLLGRHVARSPVRHYLGRVFATAVSVVLELPVYDTQCGAKLFRAGPHTAAVFAEPFSSRWVFDVEIMARYLKLFQLEHRKFAEKVYEYPLETWTDVAGSKVRPTDFFRALWDVLRIRVRYFM